MKAKCSDSVYYKSKDLTEERYDLMERINVFYSKRKDLQYEIKREKEDDPSEELIRIEEQVQECDPYIGFLHPDKKEAAPAEKDENQSKRNKDGVNYCKFHSNGFCKRGTLCKFIHQQQDCKDHIESGQCHNSVCPDRHRKDYWFYCSRKGCNKASSCVFLHREQSDILINSANEIEKKLEDSIVKLKQKVSEKDIEIENQQQELERFKMELKKKNKEIEDKNEIIKSYEEDEYSSSNHDSEDEENHDKEVEARSNNPGLVIGNGNFGMAFEVREGMEEEATALRQEWRQNKK